MLTILLPTLLSTEMESKTTAEISTQLIFIIAFYVLQIIVIDGDVTKRWWDIACNDDGAVCATVSREREKNQSDFFFIYLMRRLFDYFVQYTISDLELSFYAF